MKHEVPVDILPERKLLVIHNKNHQSNQGKTHTAEKMAETYSQTDGQGTPSVYRMTLMAQIPDLILLVSGDDQLREEQLQNGTGMHITASLNSVRRALNFSGDLSRSHRLMTAWIFHIVCVFGVRMGYLSFEPVI